MGASSSPAEIRETPRSARRRFTCFHLKVCLAPSAAHYPARSVRGRVEGLGLALSFNHKSGRSHGTGNDAQDSGAPPAWLPLRCTMTSRSLPSMKCRSVPGKIVMIFQVIAVPHSQDDLPCADGSRHGWPRHNAPINSIAAQYSRPSASSRESQASCFSFPVKFRCLEAANRL